MPRATAEGGIGTAAKKWLAGYFTNLYLGSIVLGSDADGDLYVRSGGVLTRLPKGAANLHAIMNAAGTLPEWASDVSLVNTTRDLSTATGDLAVTGAGFKPKSCALLTAVSSSIQMSIGFDDSLIGRCLYNYPGGGAGFWAIDTKLGLLYVGGAPEAYTTIIIKSYDSDGATLTFTKFQSPTGIASLFMLFFH